MKKRLAVVLALVMAVSLAACGTAKSDGKQGSETVSASAESENDSAETEETTADEAAESTADEAAESTADEAAETEETTADEAAETEEAAGNTGGTHHAEIVIKEYGTITLELDGDAAPITVENFIGLAKDGFYDGLTFHRIIDGFMIQGGDPNGNGTGGSDKTIKGEFSENGVDNPISHVAGVISMARSQDPDSASSQFFITVADSVFLDGQYAAFGHVTEGMDVAEQIAKDAEPTDGNGTIPPEAQPVIETVRILD